MFCGTSASDPSTVHMHYAQMRCLVTFLRDSDAFPFGVFPRCHLTHPWSVEAGWLL